VPGVAVHGTDHRARPRLPQPGDGFLEQPGHGLLAPGQRFEEAEHAEREAVLIPERGRAAGDDPRLGLAAVERHPAFLGSGKVGTEQAGEHVLAGGCDVIGIAPVDLGRKAEKGLQVAISGDVEQKYRHEGTRSTSASRRDGGKRRA
jgi:hypothetical protein